MHSKQLVHLVADIRQDFARLTLLTDTSRSAGLSCVSAVVRAVLELLHCLIIAPTSLTPAPAQVDALVLVELSNRDVLDRLHRGRCRDVHDPAWALTLRTYWDKELDECLIKQVCVCSTRLQSWGKRDAGRLSQLAVAFLRSRAKAAVSAGMSPLHRSATA